MCGASGQIAGISTRPQACHRGLCWSKCYAALDAMWCGGGHKKKRFKFKGKRIKSPSHYFILLANGKAAVPGCASSQREGGTLLAPSLCFVRSSSVKSQAGLSRRRGLIGHCRGSFLTCTQTSTQAYWTVFQMCRNRTGIIKYSRAGSCTTREIDVCPSM